MAKRGINRRVKTIFADNRDGGARIKVRIEVEGDVGMLTVSEVDRMIEKLTDETMLAVARVPYGNVPLSDIKIT